MDIDGADNDINTMDDNDWHLKVPTIFEVYEGGLDLSAFFTTDKDGETRTPLWSMGCYEYDVVPDERGLLGLLKKLSLRGAKRRGNL